MSKTLFTFTVNKIAEVQEERTETVKNEAGVESTRTYKETVKKEIPVEIIINQATRRQKQDADMAFSIEMSKWIKAGVLTKAMLLNKYADTGGLISDSEAKAMVTITDEIRDIQSKSIALNLKPESERDEDHKNKLAEYTAQIVRLRRQLIDRETSYLTLFNHTADIKAQNHAILWYILNLTYYKDNSDKNPEVKPLFPGKTTIDKEQVLFDLEESNNEIYEKAFSKITSIISYWFFTSNSEEEEFKKIIEEIDAPATN
jgi:hypothetical protein